MQGTNRTAAIWTRSGGGWIDSGITWKCRIQSISPTVTITSDRYVGSTHLIIGEPTPVIVEGNKLVISDETYFVAGSQMHNQPGVGNQHQEVWVSHSEHP